MLKVCKKKIEHSPFNPFFHILQIKFFFVHKYKLFLFKLIKITDYKVQVFDITIYF